MPSEKEDRYSELTYFLELPKEIESEKEGKIIKIPFEIERNGIKYKNIWDIWEFDKEKGYRLSLISSDCKYPLNQTRWQKVN